MGRRRLIIYLFPSYLLIGVLTVLALGWYATRSVTSFHLERTSTDLEARARLIAHEIGNQGPFNTVRIGRLAKELGNAAEMRVTIIGADGVVLGDSHEDTQQMDNHADRPEIISALRGSTGSSIRFSHTLNQDMMYLAIPLVIQDAHEGAVRTSLPLTRLNETVARLRTQITLVAFIILFLTAIVAYYVSRLLSKPVLAMKRQAEQFASGDLQGRMPIPLTEELASLAVSLNGMAEQLDYRIGIITQQRNEQRTILASMIEGVIAVDNDEKIIRINQAAARLFEIDEKDILGRPIQEIIRHYGIHQFVQKALTDEMNLEKELVLNRGRKFFFQVTGSILRNEAGMRIGVLLVLNDITRLKHLETMRRDFVANVSHELKTPITSIKGFVETLRSDNTLDEENIERFLEIIARQSDRLNTIIDDLLTLASIEQMETDTPLEFQEAPLLPIVEAVVQDSSPVISKRNTTVEIDCQESLTASVNVHLLEQALTNLIGNAARYGNDEGRVIITVRDEKNIIIEVADDGPGIPPEHLPHLFTRFYRIDRDRSRKAGGTGLGLAIVKHIALAHNGAIEVKSELGVGSKFTLKLPKIRS
ncbi:MAG: PAS domain-containing protein [Candidatus Marinimicrobia bacterium]|nr:PAS domain-containing protein [Candidatus Neomarinimicrobiota bacterium]